MRWGAAGGERHEPMTDGVIAAGLTTAAQSWLRPAASVHRGLQHRLLLELREGLLREASGIDKSITQASYFRRYRGHFLGGSPVKSENYPAAAIGGRSHKLPKRRGGKGQAEAER